MELNGRSVNTHIPLVEYGILSFTRSRYSLPVYCLQCKLIVLHQKSVNSILFFPFLSVLDRMIIKIKKKKESL